MPLYDYSCPGCKLDFEVSRTFKEADDPVYCPMCNTESKRQLSVPMTTFTRGSAAESLRQGPAFAPSKWSHHGHSHGSGTGTHSH